MLKTKLLNLSVDTNKNEDILLKKLVNIYIKINNKKINKKTFDDYKNIFLEVYKSKKVASPTLEEYYYLLNKLADVKIDGIRIGDYQISTIDRQTLQRAFNTLSSYSETVVKKIRFLSSALFEYAVEDGLCDNNPTIKVDIAFKKSLDKKCWSADEYIRIFDFAITDKYFALPMIILLSTGMRSGELRALQVKHYDFHHKGFHVVQAIKKTGKIGLPKGNKKRFIPIHTLIAQVIEREILNIPKATFFLGGGSYVSESSLRSRYLCFFKRLNKEQIINKNELIPKFSPHATRHTYITVLQEKGVPVGVVSALAGHCSLEITSKYTHLSNIATMKKAINKLQLLDF